MTGPGRPGSFALPPGHSNARPLRRQFARLVALSASAGLIPRGAHALEELNLSNEPLPPMPAQPDERRRFTKRARSVAMFSKACHGTSDI